ncbi:MAG: RDD family protein [Actinobacteria bacterium]|nr:RDD family protein [Actinomycetota bacterium]
MAVNRSPVSRVMGAIVPRAMDAIDPDDIIERVDIDGVLQRVDIDAVIQRVDIDAILQRVDIDGLMGRVDIDALMGRVDIDALMGRVDIDALMGRVDINRLLDQVDLPTLVARAGIDQIVRDATSGIATRTIDLARRQILGLDVIALGMVDRSLGRRATPTVERVDETGTSHVAVDGRRAGGPLARTLAFLADSLTVSASFGLAVALGALLLGVFTGHEADPVRDGGPVWLVAYTAWWFLYLWVSISIAGRTIGKALLGLQVVAVDGGRLGPARAAVRAVVLPVSMILGLGLLPAVLGRSRRALHDYAARSQVVVDWGGRDVALPGALSDWVAAREQPSGRRGEG